MNTQMRRLAATVAVLALGMSGCGGGSSQTSGPPVAGAPTPSPTPTPTPTPSPTPAAFAGPAALIQLEDFAVLSFAYIGTTSANTPGTLETRLDGVAFRYIAATKRHQMTIPEHGFGVLGTPTTAQPNPVFTNQSVTESEGAADFTYDLSLLIPGAANRLLPLTYTSYGNWDASRTQANDPNLLHQNFGGFAYGVPTAVSGLPATGVAEYRGLVFDLYATPGNIVVTIDFATGRITGTVDAKFNDGIGGIDGPGPIDFDGALKPGTSMAEINFPIGATGRTGSLTMQLTGPGAEELMLRWSATVIVPHLQSTPMPVIVLGAANQNAGPIYAAPHNSH